MKNILMCSWILIGACSNAAGNGSGSLDVLVMPEETISEGLAPGDGAENIRDGWTVAYSRFLVTIGNFSSSVSSSPTDAVSDASVFVLDLQTVPTSGYELAHFEDMSATRWDRVGYQMPNASDTDTCAAGIDSSECATMKSEHLSVWVTGTLTKDGESPLSFDWKLPAGASFGDCQNSDGLNGFAITSGASQQVELTVHGDHWFFTRYPTGDEAMSPISRCASWIAAADGTDGSTADRNITNAELMALSAASAFPTSATAGDCRYDLSAFPHPVNNAYDYVLQMARSLGHFQGEGDCETRSDLN